MSALRCRQICVVYGKELHDILRDRRTLMSMLLIPGVLIPLLIVGGSVVTFKTVHQAETERASVMVVGAGDAAPRLRAAIQADPKLRLLPTGADFAARIAQKTLRAAIEIPNDYDESNLNVRPPRFKIYDYEGELKSGFAAAELERLTAEYRDNLVQARLSGRGLDRAFIRPFEVVRQNVAPPEKVGGNRFGGIIPYLLIMACFTGAMYPAIDLGTGEKERGTMETILCTPVGRLELALGKFFTVLTVSLATVATALLGLLLTAVTLAFVVLPHLQGPGHGAVISADLPTLNPVGLLCVLVVMLPLATFFSAVIFAIALTAKTQKEAQTYISPLIGLLVLPAFAPMLPGVELNTKFALIPILNISLVSKELVSGNFPWLMIAVIFGSSLFYALIAIGVAVRLFKRETIIFRT